MKEVLPFPQTPIPFQELSQKGGIIVKITFCKGLSCHPERKNAKRFAVELSCLHESARRHADAGSIKEQQKLYVDPFVAPLLGFAPASQNFDSKMLRIFSLRMTR